MNSFYAVQNTLLHGSSSGCPRFCLCLFPSHPWLMKWKVLFHINIIRIRIISWLRRVMNPRTILTKGVVIGIRNWSLGLRVGKLDQWEALLVNILIIQSCWPWPLRLWDWPLVRPQTWPGRVSCADLTCFSGRLSLQHIWELPVLHNHKIMVIYPYPFFMVINQLFYWILFICYCICILTGSPVYYLFIFVYVIQEIGGKDNSPYYLNVIVNCHYHGRNRVITQKFASMLRRPTCEFTEYIAALLLLLSTVAHTGVDQYGIHNYEEYYDEDSAMVDVMSPSQDPICRRSIWMIY